MKILIAGAGIGGLTAALALRRAGFDVHVYEQTSVLREVGAGLALGPNAVAVLQRLGLADALRAVSVVPLSMDPRDWRSGERLARIPLGDEATRRWGAPLYHIHRADLHDALRAAVGDENLTLGARCVAVEQRGAAAVLSFADGSSARGDLVVGADGIHSIVREHVAGTDRPIWSRQFSWRGLAPGAVGREIGLDVRHHSFWGPGKQFVCFYVSAGRLVNWVGNMESDDESGVESWSARGDRAEALDCYTGWHPLVRALIAATEHVFKWALFDRPPLQQWTRGRVTLLGDAAHPMLPYMAQGASQSIEDAAVLARCLVAGGDDPERALLTYSATRRDRAAALQDASRNMGRTVQLSDPDAIAARNARMRAEGDAYAARYDWLWGYDVERVPPET